MADDNRRSEYPIMATTPMNKRTGITIGGTRYFTFFPFVRRTGAAAS
jgi:hypothetical protein